MELLAIEDDEVDVMTIKRALKDLNRDIKLIHFENGLEAIKYLKESGKGSKRVILLDINTPVMNGIEFLEMRLTDPVLSMIPVVVMTTSKNESDKTECYRRFASSYFVKPVSYMEFVNIMDVLTRYWDKCEISTT